MADRYWVGGSSNWASTANWSTTSGGPSGASVPTAADNVFFDQASTYTVTVTTATTINCFNFTASAGSPTFSMSGAAININGDFDVSGSTGGNFFGSGPAISFGPTSGGTATLLTINCGTRGLATSGTLSFRWNSAAVFVYRLLSNLSIQNTANTVTLVRGELDLNGYTINCGSFAATNANSKAISSGTGGKIVLNSLGGTAFSISGGATTITGDLLVQTTNSSSSGITIVLSIITNPISFLFTGSNYGLTFLDSANARVKDITFSGGYSGTWAGRTNAQNVSGNITLSPGMTYGASTGTMSLTGSSGTQTITTNGRTWDGPLNVNTTGATVQLAGALNMGTRALTLSRGTFDGGGYSIAGSASIAVVTGPVTVRNINTARTIVHSSGVLTFGTNNTVGAYGFTAGTLDLANYQLNCLSFTSNGTSVRTLAFGTGNITCTGLGGILFNSTSTTNLTVTGTPVVNIPYSGATATTIAAFPSTEAQSISFNIQAGTYALTMLDTNRNYRSINFTGFSGTLGTIGTNQTIYGSLTFSPTMTLSAGGGTLTFGGTAVGNTITTSGKIFTFKVVLNGVGASWILQDALTMSGALSNIRHYNGTLDLNGKTLTLDGSSGNSYYTDPGTKNITFNGGTIIAKTDFVNQTPVGFTTTAGTGVGKISVQKATGFTFTGGGSTYNCTISNDGAGALSITGNNAIQTLTTTVGNITLTGSNTIGTISNAVQPVTFTFPNGATQTITNWNVSGTAGNLVTLISDSSGISAALSKSSGTVSADYLSIKDSAATGGAAWYAGANSINVSGNSGWIFTAAPMGAFFFMF